MGVASKHISGDCMHSFAISSSIYECCVFLWLEYFENQALYEVVRCLAQDPRMCSAVGAYLDELLVVNTAFKQINVSPPS